MSDKKWVVYLVRCSDNPLYCGISNDIKNRLVEHNSGRGVKYTRTRRPVELVGISPEMTKSEALKLEYRIKQLPANKKISGFFKEGGRNDNCKGYESNNKRHGCWGSVRYASALGDDKECISEAIQVFRPCKTEVCLKQANEALASMEKM